MQTHSISSAAAFQVQQTFGGEFVCNVGTPCSTQEEAEAQCSDCYRSDWERTGQITPTTLYLVARTPKEPA